MSRPVQDIAVPSVNDIDSSVKFHGHMCPGLAIGIRAARFAVEYFQTERSLDEELVAVVETDMCAVDALQSLVGTTFGKGNLIHRDWGKNAFAFYSRRDGRSVRLVTRPDSMVKDPEHARLFDLVRSGQATADDQQQFQVLHHKRSQAILEANFNDLFHSGEPREPLPEPARIHRSVVCASCREALMETRARIWRGDIYCIPCFEGVENR